MLDVDKQFIIKYFNSDGHDTELEIITVYNHFNNNTFSICRVIKQSKYEFKLFAHDFQSRMILYYNEIRTKTLQTNLA